MIFERISDNKPPVMKTLNMVIPILMHVSQFHLKLLRCMPQNPSTCHPTICDLINDVKPCSTVHHWIYCCKFLTLIKRCVTKASALELARYDRHMSLKHQVDPTSVLVVMRFIVKFFPHIVPTDCRFSWKKFHLSVWN